MGRRPNAFNSLELQRKLKRFDGRDKRQVIRKYLFGENGHKYPCGSRGEELNEYELDQIIVFFAVANYDNFHPSTFSQARASKIDSIEARTPKGRLSLANTVAGPRDVQDGGSPVGGRGSDLDRLLSEIDREQDRSDDDEGPRLESSDDGISTED